MRNRSRRVVNWLRIGTVFAVALTIFSVWYTAYNRATIAFYQNEVDDHRETIANVQVFERRLRDARNESQALQSEVDKVGALSAAGQIGHVVRFLAALSAAAGEGVLFESIAYDQGGLATVAGIGLSPADVSDFLSQVERLPGVDEANLADMRRISDSDELLRGFSLRIAWAGERTQP